jgi:hypothetical protein
MARTHLLPNAHCGRDCADVQNHEFTNHSALHSDTDSCHAFMAVMISFVKEKKWTRFENEGARDKTVLIEE